MQHPEKRRWNAGAQRRAVRVGGLAAAAAAALTAVVIVVAMADAEDAGPAAGVAALPVVQRVATPEWRAGEPFPERRTEVSATTDGRYVYVAGGFGPPEGEERATAPRTLWRLDPAAGEWTALTEIPEGVHHAPFQYHDGRLYILGGFRGTGFTPTAAVRIYDLATDEWSAGAPMPTPRGASGWAVLDGRIHVIGGNAVGAAAVRDRPGTRILDDRSVNVHEAYDPASDTWIELSPMPTPRNHLGAATTAGRIHAVLGRADGDFTLTTHEIYEPETDSWIDAPAVPTGRSGVAVVQRDGAIYAFGGERLGEGAGTFDAAERYDPRTGQWEQLPAMPSPRHGLGAAVVDGVIHVVSGGPGPGFTFGNAHDRLVHRP